MSRPIPTLVWVASDGWLNVPLADYEGHMKSAEVQQLGALSDLFAQALAFCRPGFFVLSSLSWPLWPLVPSRNSPVVRRRINNLAASYWRARAETKNQELRAKNKHERQMTTENGQRTKRKYTVTDKVLAANRLNLEKARAVDKKIRYRATPKRLEGNRASLIKARQSPNYKPYVRYGLRAVDLHQSAPQVGETLEEYDRHTQLVERVLPANRQRLHNGVRGLAQALWRRRRLFGSRVHRETLSFYLELEKVGVWGLCPASVQTMSFNTWHLFMEGEHPRQETMMDCLDKRLVRVAEAYLADYTRDLVHLGVWGKHVFRADFLDQPPEVIGNGLLGRAKVKRRLQKGITKAMKAAALFAWVLKVARLTKSGLLKAWVERGYPLPDPRRKEDFALHLRLMEAAFFGNRNAGFNLETGNSQLETGNAKPASLDARVAKFKSAAGRNET